MEVYPIRALQDNYMYLLVDKKTKHAAAIDPVDAVAMSNAVTDHSVDLKCILTTHHHYDHAHGNADLVGMYPDIVVYGGDSRVQAITKPVVDNEKLRLGELTIECLSTPCHTKGHICYYVHNEPVETEGIQAFIPSVQEHQQKDSSSDFPSSPPPAAAFKLQTESPDEQVERVVFTGDTLFIAGCGRFFEGSPEQMDKNLNTILGSLPSETKVYCGHEYTVTNLKFALMVEPSNSDIKLKLDWAQNRLSRRLPTVPSTIGEEKRINPFMRLNRTEVRNFTKEQTDLEVMSELRQKKNDFVP